jgi:hypothetical protein
VIYSRAFFDLQFDFARRAAHVAGMPVEQALLDYTNFYARFGLGRAFDAGHPVWRAYLAGLAQAADPCAWTHDFYLGRGPDLGPKVAASVGCFSVEIASDALLRVHFQNVERDGHPPLADDRHQTRLGELRALFAEVPKLAPGATRVAGTSWLYHLPGYRRLYPPLYLASAMDAGPRFRNLPLWGQLVDRHGSLRPSAERAFRGRMESAATPADLAACFPLHPLALEAPTTAFFAFHGL